MEPTTTDFEWALGRAKAGKRIFRRGWNGPGQWVCFMPGMVLDEDKVNERTRKFIPSGPLTVGGYFVIHTAQGVWQPGWLASQGDLLATDWEVLEDGE